MSDDTLVPLLRLVLMHRRGALLWAFLASLALVGWRTFMPRQYRSSATVIIPAAVGAGAAGAIASQLGLGASAARGVSPTYVSEVALSSHVLRALAGSDFAVDSHAVPLYTILGVDVNDPAEARERAVDPLRKKVEARVSEVSGNIGLAVRAPSAKLAQDVLRRWISIVDSTDGVARRRTATLEAADLARQRKQAEDSLEASERRLTRLLESNRSVSQSPLLQQQVARGERAVAFWTQVRVQSALAEQRAMSEATRGASQLSILLEPSLPPLPERRNRVFWALVGFAAGAGIYLGARITVDLLRGPRPSLTSAG